VRILTDANALGPFSELLRKLGWDVRTACDEGLAGKVGDDKLVHRATELDRIFITLDELRAQHGKDVARELRTNGGKVIQIKGGTGQHPYKALGRLLFHFIEWEQFLHVKDGVVVISDIGHNCMTYTPRRYHHRFHQTDVKQFEQYLAKRRRKLVRPRGRRKKAALNGQPFLDTQPHQS
jgi:hypothetical protein